MLAENQIFYIFFGASPTQSKIRYVQKYAGLCILLNHIILGHYVWSWKDNINSCSILTVKKFGAGKT